MKNRHESGQRDGGLRDGLELAARFSYITNALRYCGPSHAADAFITYLKTKQNKEVVEDALKKFEGLYPYLSSIAKKHSKNFSDYDVVEAYWIGNDLLDAFTDDDLKEIILLLTKRGLPKAHAEKLIRNLPHGLFPHHDFNVFYVGVGMTSGTVATTLQNMENCRISWGTVVEIHPQNLVVASQTLKQDNKKLFLEEGTKTVDYKSDILNVKIGDRVAMHWGFTVCTLENVQQAQLEKYTRKLLQILNNHSVIDAL